MTRKELEEQVTGLLMPVASPDWLVERVCNFVELYARQQNLQQAPVSSSASCSDEDCDDDCDDYDEEDYREEMLERRVEERAMLAATCTCGAWQFAKDGSVAHVADCCCGAE